MRRMLLLLWVAGMMLALTAAPAFAAPPADEGCPSGGDFEEGPNELQDPRGTPSAFVNESDELCTKELKAKPQAPQFCCDPVITVFRDDTVRGP